MTKKEMEERRAELVREANRNAGENAPKNMDPIHHLTHNQGKEFMQLEFLLGYSDFDPDDF